MKSTAAAALACIAMLGAAQHASADELCRCWQETTSVSKLFVSTRQAFLNLNREEPSCHTRCACPGLRIKGIALDGTICVDHWCLSGAGGVGNGDETVSLFSGGELSRLDHQGASTVVAVGSDACD